MCYRLSIVKSAGEFNYTCLFLCSGLEIREYGREDTSCWPRGTLYPQKLALISPASGGRSVDIGRSRTQATEFSFFFIFMLTSRRTL
jgi:hypothetical protein